MNAIVPLAFGEIERLAVSIARSGLFGIKTPDQAMALMLISQAEGRHPALAARDFDIIQGRPAKKAEAMLRDFLEAGGSVKWHALDDTIADATFSHPQGGSARISWDMKRAGAAGLGGKDNWKKFPRQMLRSRTVSEGVRTIWPMATSGLYEPGEVADIPAHTGPTIEHEPPPPAPEPRQEQTKRTISMALDELEARLRDCPDLAAVERIIAAADTQRLAGVLQNGAVLRFDAILAAARAAHAPVVHEDPFGEAAGWPGPDPAEMREREAAA
jgi:hypothetical protein